MKLIQDTPGSPALYLCSDDEIAGDSDALNELLPDAAPGTIVTTAGYGTMKQVDAEGVWHLISLGGGGSSGGGGIDSSTTCTLTGVLAGSDGAVTVKTVDSSPTSASTNLVTSGGVYSALAAKADLASPELTGTPTAPTATAGTNTTQIATTAFVQAGLGARFKEFVLNAGQTLTIATPQNNNGLYAMLVATSGGNGGTHNACFYLSGFSNSIAASYKNVTTIQAATNVVVTANNANFTIANTHGTYRCNCGVVIITDAAGILTFAVT